MMDFQGLASKVKAAAAKINFDQMAANDDYIHSEDLNVTGRNNRRKSNPESTTGMEPEESLKMTSSTATATATTTTNTKTTGSVHNYTPHNTDTTTTTREQLTSSLVVPAVTTTTTITTTSSARRHHVGEDSLKSNSTHIVEDRQQRTRNGNSNNDTQPLLRQSTMPLLSVVANTLAQAQQQQQQQQQQQKQQQQQQAQNGTSSGKTTAMPTRPREFMTMTAATTSITNGAKVDGQQNRLDRNNTETRKNGKYEDDDDDDSESDDDDDAILSLIRDKKKKKTPSEMANASLSSAAAKRHTSAAIELSYLSDCFEDDYDQREISDHSSSSHSRKKKNPKRFLEDLDQRLSTPVDLERGSTEEEDKAANDNIIIGINQQWSWIQNAVASSRINTLLGQPLSSIWKQQADKAPVRKGPLSRREAAPLLRDEDDAPVVMVHSSAVLAADEQAELARLAHRSTSSSLVSRDVLGLAMDMFKQNPAHSLFVVFTLVVALAVYFYSRNRNIMV